MDDLQLLADLVRDDPLPGRGHLAPARAALFAPSRPFRRLVWLAGAVTAASAASAVLAVGYSPHSSAVFPQSIPSAAPADLSFRLVADSPAETQATANRLKAELDAALGRAAPGARWSAGPVLKGWDGQGQELFNGGGTVTLGAKHAEVALIVTTETNLLTCPAQARDCAPDASGRLALTLTGGGRTQVQARAALPGGRILIIGQDGPAADPQPLTRDQVLAIATDITGKIKA